MIGLSLANGYVQNASVVGGGAAPYENSHSLEFDGASDYVNIGASGNLGTISLWFKSDSAVTSGSTGQYLVSFSANGSLFGSVSLGSNTGYGTNEVITVHQGTRAYAWEDAAVTIDTDWHHLAARWTGSTYDIYLDGTEKRGGSGGTGPGAAGLIAFSALKIGANPGYYPYSYGGLIDEVAIWDTPLSDTETIALSATGSPADLSSLSPDTWWRMGEDATWDGSNWTIPDAAAGEGETGDEGTTVSMAESSRVTDTP